MRDLGNRIMLIGCGGSGKSTLARQLGDATGLPVVYLDRERARYGGEAEWLRAMSEFAAADRWILDGNFGVPNMDERMARATSIVFLDFPRRLCLWRGLRRNLAQQIFRRERGDGCPARPDWTFIRWVWRFPKVQRVAILEKLQSHPGKAVVLRGPRDVRRLLDG